jgi:hypothetical protein
MTGPRTTRRRVCSAPSSAVTRGRPSMRYSVTYTVVIITAMRY